MKLMHHNFQWKDGSPIDERVIAIIKGDYYFHGDSANRLVARYNNCKNMGELVYAF
jgi:hypothetical protein